MGNNLGWAVRLMMRDRGSFVGIPVAAAVPIRLRECPSHLNLHSPPPCPARTTTEEVSLPTLKAKISITLLRVSPALFPNAYQ